MTDVDATDTSNPDLNYGLVVDCGSSGSRVFVYCWPRHNGNLHELLNIQQMRDRHRKPVVMKIKPGESLKMWLSSAVKEQLVSPSGPPPVSLQASLN